MKIEVIAFKNHRKDNNEKKAESKSRSLVFIYYESTNTAAGRRDSYKRNNFRKKTGLSLLSIFREISKNGTT